MPYVIKSEKLLSWAATYGAVDESGIPAIVRSAIDSYKLVAKYFKRGLYIKVAFRKMIFKPIIQRRLRKANINL